jgi:hypothetical protein
MEDRLIPYYHYIPLARHATDYVEDLWMSDKAKSDTEEIVSRLVHRYQYHYGGSLGNCPPPGSSEGTKDQNVDEE